MSDPDVDRSRRDTSGMDGSGNDNGNGNGDGLTDAVRWKRIPASDPPNPIVVRRPYVEVSLVHPDLPATRVGGSFYPSALPYSLDDERRIFYWRHALPAQSAVTAVAEADVRDGDHWIGVCATPDSLVPLYDDHGTALHVDAAMPLDLTSAKDEGTEVVVDSTIAGDSTTALVEGYREPEVAVRELTRHAVEVTVDGRSTIVPAGAQTEIPTEQQSVRLLEEPADSATRHGGSDGRRNTSDEEWSGEGQSGEDGSDEAVTTTPTVVVRYPGTRTIYHPSPEGDTLVFPSFGVDLADVPKQLPVDPDSLDRDLDAIADAMGAERSARPYAEHVLWEAFVYAAFDPERDETIGLTQFENGLLAVHDPPDSMTGT